MNRRRTLADIVGLAVIVLGVVIALVIYNTYDAAELEEAKSWTSTTIEEDTYIEVLKTEKVYTIVASFVIAISGVVIGTILTTLGGIQATIELIAIRNDGDIDVR